MSSQDNFPKLPISESEIKKGDTETSLAELRKDFSMALDSHSELDKETREILKLSLVEKSRAKIAKIISHPAYEKVQMAATLISVFADSIYRTTCAKFNVPVDESVADTLHSAPSAVFAVNLALKSALKGKEHFKTPEAWIDIIAVISALTHGNIIGNTRVLRLMKGIRGMKIIKGIKSMRQTVKMMRAIGMGRSEHSLEDKVMQNISQDFTWFMIAVFASFPLIADFKDIDYSDLTDVSREFTFNIGLIIAAKIFNNRVRKIIHKNYTETLDASRDRVHDMIKEHPELAFLKDRFKYFDKKSADHLAGKLNVSQLQIENLVHRMKNANGSSMPRSLIWKKWCLENGIAADYDANSALLDKVSKDEILVIVEGLLESMVSLKDLINPVGEDLELDENGNIRTKEVDAVVMVTDLRNFTPLTTNEKIGGEIFAFLKLNYFVYLREVIKRHHGKILNHTGDGLVIYFTDTKDSSKEENSIACSREINDLTNLANEVWHNTGTVNEEDNHETGIGLAWGTIRIGDILTLSKEEREGGADILSIQKAFEAEAVKISPWIEDMHENRNKGDVSRLVGMGEPINLAARLESISKKFPHYTGFIRESQFVKLPEDLMLQFEALEPISLKGVSSTEMLYGMPRYVEKQAKEKKGNKELAVIPL